MRHTVAAILAMLTFSIVPGFSQLDFNSNGMSDVWERFYNRSDPGGLFDPANPDHAPDADPDGDGWSNLQESVAGTDPFEGSPPEGMVATYVTYLENQFEAATIEFPAGRLVDIAIVSWETLPGKRYTLHFSPDLADSSWIAIDDPVIGNGNPCAVAVTLTDTAGERPERLFWRVIVEDPAIDSDGDGLTDFEEYLLGSNPFSADTSGDGVPDRWLAAHGFNPSQHHGEVNFPGSDLSVTQAWELGVQEHPDAHPDDLDGDGVINHLDAVPWDKRARWSPASRASYVVVPLGTPGNYEGGTSGVSSGEGNLELFLEGRRVPNFGLTDLGSDGSILLTEDRRRVATSGEPFRTWLNRPGGGWNELSWPPNAVATGIAVDGIGNVLGIGLVPLLDEEGDPPPIGISAATRTWLHDGNTPTLLYDSFPLTGAAGIGTAFQYDHYPLYSSFVMQAGMDDHGNIYHYAAYSNGAVINDQLRRGDTVLHVHQPSPPAGPGGMMPSGSDHFLLSRDGDIMVNAAADQMLLHPHTDPPTPPRDGPDGPHRIMGLVPDNITRLHRAEEAGAGFQFGRLADDGLWVEQSNGDWKCLRRDAESVRANADGRGASGTGGIAMNARGEILIDPATLWRNGESHAISDLVVTPDWNNFHLTQINNDGLIAGFASPDNGEPEVVLLVPVTISIDSDNTNGFARPDRTAKQRELREWPPEAPLDPAFPGKILLVNSGDEDGDGVPDFTDGLDVFANDGMRYPESAPDRTETARLVPMLVEIEVPGGDWESVRIRFQYDASDPSAIQKSGPSDEPRYEPAPGSLRLWKRSESGHQYGDEENPSPIRKVASVDFDGDYIPPDTILTLFDLGFEPARKTIVLYIEAVSPSETIRDHVISVEVDFDGTGGPLDFVEIGSVECTSIDIGLVQLLPDGTTAPASTVEASSPIPTLEIDHLAITSVAPSLDYSEILGSLEIAGTVGSFLADITPPSGPGAFSEVFVYVNDDSEPVGVIPVVGGKSEDTASHLRPYPFEGSFGTTFTGVSLIEGANEIVITAIDPVDGSEARAIYSIEVTAISSHASVNGGSGDDVTATLLVELSHELDPEALDTLAASLNVAGGATGQILLVETGDGTREFTDVQQDFTLRIIAGGDTLDPAGRDVIAAHVTHSTLAPGGLWFPVVRETGNATHVFSQYLVDDSESWQAEDYEDFELDAGPAILVNATLPGTAFPYMMRLSGPEMLLDFIDDIETADGPRKVEKSPIDGHYYVKMKNSRPAVYIWRMWREVAAADSNEERILVLLDMLAAELGDTIQYQIGLAHGLWDGGADMIEGMEALLKFVVEASLKWTGPALTIRWLNGDKFEAEKKAMQVSAKTLRTLGDLYMLMRGEQSAFNEPLVTSLLAGDNQAINAHIEALGDKYGDTIIAVAELLEALADQVSTLTPRRQGYYMGRASFEVFSLAFAWEVRVPALIGAGTKFTKANFLKALEKLPFFQAGNGQAAFAKLLAQGDYLTRLATTKMCFPPGTPVATAHGPVAIEHIRPDDIVWSRCEETGILALKPVVQLFTTHPDRLYHLVTRSGGGNSDDGEADTLLASTATHPFWVVEKQTFVPASELAPGDTFLTLGGGHETLESIHIEYPEPGESFTTHNFEVADFHTYFAGEEAVWVHNSGNACHHFFSLYDRFRRLNQKSPEEAWRLMEKMYVGHLDQSGVFIAGTNSGKYSSLAMGNALEEALRKDVYFSPNIKLWTKGNKKSSGHNMHEHYVDHVLKNKSGILGGEFPNVTNAVDYVKHARLFVSQADNNVINWVQGGDKLFFHKIDARFAVQDIASGEMRTYFRANPGNGSLLDWVRKRGYTGLAF